MTHHNYRKPPTIISLLILSLGIFLSACSSVNRDVPVVKPFDQQRYLGQWYEIARTNNRFQRGLAHSFAEYSLNKNGTIKVVNRGYNPVEKAWTKAIGKAKFVDTPTVGRLKVSFFGPFYGGYNIVAIDPNYLHALIIGDSPNYMWILSRQKHIPSSIKATYLAKAKALGVNIDALIWDKQNLEYPAKELK